MGCFRWNCVVVMRCSPERRNDENGSVLPTTAKNNSEPFSSWLCLALHA